MDGSTFYDALDLSFSASDKTRILQIHNVDIVASKNTKAVSNDVYNKGDIDVSFWFNRSRPRYIIHYCGTSYCIRE